MKELLVTSTHRQGRRLVSKPKQVGGSHYDDCEQAAANYCEQVVKAGESDLDACVAKYAFQCISGASD